LTSSQSSGPAIESGGHRRPHALAEPKNQFPTPLFRNSFTGFKEYAEKFSHSVLAFIPWFKNNLPRKFLANDWNRNHRWGGVWLDGLRAAPSADAGLLHGGAK
jgi:hypothetical protein